MSLVHNVKWGAVALLIIGGLLSQGTATGAQMPMTRDPGHRVVFHFNSADEQAQKGLLNNITNLYEALGTDFLRVELVVHGAGLSLMTKTTSRFAGELARLKQEYGVELTACSNTMKAQGLVRADLLDQVDRTVPAMVRLMELQEAGWSYIKP
jgi:intracellular sulfur oxidation DsrE/DsrF family protein